VLGSFATVEEVKQAFNVEEGGIEVSIARLFSASFIFSICIKL
jgi:hypothetical protein